MADSTILQGPDCFETDYDYERIHSPDDYSYEKPLIGCKGYVEIKDINGK